MVKSKTLILIAVILVGICFILVKQQRLPLECSYQPYSRGTPEMTRTKCVRTDGLPWFRNDQ